MTLQMTRDMVTQLLGQAAFYETCPEFVAIRPDAETRYNEYLAILQGKACPGCTSRSIMDPAIQAFIDVLIAPETDRDRVRAYLGTCRRQRVLVVRFVYKRQGRVQEIKF